MRRHAWTMRVGRYAVHGATLKATWRMLADSRRVRRHGIPRLAHDEPAEVARAVLRANAGAVLRAGAGHFHDMWVADFGKAFGGALHALPREYLAAQLDRVAATSAPLGRVPTCFTPKGWHDLPWPRADSLPWLLVMMERLGDDELVARHHAGLQRLWDAWREGTLDPATGLVRDDVTGDWMDTVPRPSSTYNNLVALAGARAARRLGLAGEGPDAKRLLDARWSGTHLRDHARAGDYLSADANVPALYLGVLPEHARRAIASTLEQSALVRPIPMRTREGAYAREELPALSRLTPSYHSTTWLHLGLMHANGLKREGLPWREHVARVEEVVRAHGNFLETLGPDARPHVSRWLSTEHGFSMSAGLYLEAVEG